MNGPVPEPPPRPRAFGPDDASTLDAAAVQRRIEANRQRLLAAQLKLTRMRYGPGPDGTDPVVREVTRADSQWPFLLVRSFPGDAGGRPLEPPEGTTMEEYASFSPDIIVTWAGPKDAPRIVDRPGLADLYARGLTDLQDEGSFFDVWVHVWNLGRVAATGVRLRVREAMVADPFVTSGPFLGGATVDLSDRLGDRSHLAVKVVTFTPRLPFAANSTCLAVTADCLSDPASGDLSLGIDRHTAVWRPGILRNMLFPRPRV